METLVLDQSYIPVGRCTWQRAITLFFQGKVEILDKYEDQSIRAVTVSFKMPAVVRFLNALRKRKNNVKFSRLNVHARDNGQCQYCAKPVTLNEMTYDHVVPRAQGGKTTWDNVVVACIPCNQKKAGRTPQQAGMKLRTKPVQPKKLPEHRMRFTWHKGMPDKWRNWFGDMARDFTYWNGELEEV